MGVMRYDGRVGLRGDAVLEVRELDGSLVQRVQRSNVCCTDGLLFLAQAVNWSGIEDQNSNMGGLFTATTLAPVYGALGSSFGTTFTLGASVASGASVTLLTASAPVTIAANSVITVGAGAATSQTFVCNGGVSSGTLIPVFAATAVATFAVATTCGFVSIDDSTLYSETARTTVAAASYTGGSGFGSWTWLFFFGTSGGSWTINEAGVFVNADSGVGDGNLFDHLLISPTVTKTASQTASLQITFTIGN